MNTYLNLLAVCQIWPSPEKIDLLKSSPCHRTLAATEIDGDRSVWKIHREREREKKRGGERRLFYQSPEPEGIERATRERERDDWFFLFFGTHNSPCLSVFNSLGVPNFQFPPFLFTMGGNENRGKEFIYFSLLFSVAIKQRKCLYFHFSASKSLYQTPPRNY